MKNQKKVHFIEKRKIYENNAYLTKCKKNSWFILFVETDKSKSLSWLFICAFRAQCGKAQEKAAGEMQLHNAPLRTKGLQPAYSSWT